MRYSFGYFEVNELVDLLKSNGITPLSVTHRRDGFYCVRVRNSCAAFATVLRLAEDYFFTYRVTHRATSITFLF